MRAVTTGFWLLMVSGTLFAQNPPAPELALLTCADKDLINYGIMPSAYTVFQCCEWDGGECGCQNGTVLCCDGQLSFCPCSNVSS